MGDILSFSTVSLQIFKFSFVRLVSLRVCWKKNLCSQWMPEFLVGPRHLATSTQLMTVSEISLQRVTNLAEAVSRFPGFSLYKCIFILI